MISYKEFLKYTEGSNYDDEEWKDIDQEDLYNDEELDEFAKHFNGDYCKLLYSDSPITSSMTDTPYIVRTLYNKYVELLH